MKRRILSLSLSIIMCMSLGITAAFAVSSDATTLDEEPVLEEIVYINPLYEDTISEDDLIQPTDIEENAPEVLNSTFNKYGTIEDAGNIVREAMVNRQNQVTVYVIGDQLSDYTTQTYQILDEAMKHTGVADEGDYLMWQYAGWSATINYMIQNGKYYFTYNYTITYYTDAEQEARVTEKVNDVLDTIISDDMTDYEKVCAIYHYICCNVKYDNVHKNDTSYKTQFTAYGALIDGTSVCQGYAILFYRMALECGIDARIITGTEYNTSEAHGWNIVCLDGKYYNLDATWDTSVYNSRGTYEYFLETTESFNEHVRGSSYSSTSFNTEYPMSTTDYSKPYTYHAMVLTDSTVSCKHEGYKTYTCAVCGATETQSVSGTGEHIWDDGKITRDATCTTDGVITYICTECGQTKTESIPSTGHTWSEAEITSPTCTKEGSEVERCLTCGEETIVTLDKLDHEWDEATVITKPTCGEDGELTHTCTVCGYTETAPIDATGEHDWVLYDSAEATCAADGFVHYICSVCGTEDYDIIQSLDHTWDEGTIIIEPTCGAGTIEYTCIECGAIYEEDIPAIYGIEHDWVESDLARTPTCTEYGEDRYICSVCGEHKLIVLEPTGHTLDGESIITEPTCTEDGYETYTCSVCGENVTDIIPATGHINIVHIDAVDATVKSDGNIEYWYCTDCETYFADADLTEEITLENTVILAFVNQDIQDIDEQTDNTESKLNDDKTDSTDTTDESVEDIDNDINKTSDDTSLINNESEFETTDLDTTGSNDINEKNDIDNTKIADIISDNESEQENTKIEFDQTETDTDDANDLDAYVKGVTDEKDDMETSATDSVQTSDTNTVFIILMIAVLFMVVLDVTIIQKEKLFKIN